MEMDKIYFNFVTLGNCDIIIDNIIVDSHDSDTLLKLCECSMSATTSIYPELLEKDEFLKPLTKIELVNQNYTRIVIMIIDKNDKENPKDLRNTRNRIPIADATNFLMESSYIVNIFKNSR